MHLFFRSALISAFVFGGLLLGCGELPHDVVDESSAESSRSVTSARLRLVAANLTSGSAQSYDLGHGTRILQWLNPDIVMIQEFNVGDKSPEAARAYVDATFGADFNMYREAGRGIPNGIISRYPIVESGEWEDAYTPDRDFAWARIDIPGPTDLWAVSVHLRTSGNRPAETAALSQKLKAHVPAGDYLVVGGDFNTGSHNDPCFQNLADLVGVTGPFPRDLNNNFNTNRGRNEPYDYVLVDGDLEAFQTTTIIGARSFTGGFVADTRAALSSAELSPAYVDDSNAPNMQHMAIVKDFALPAIPPEESVTVTYPNGGETLIAGSTVHVTWSITTPGAVKVEYTIDGATWNSIASSVTQTSTDWLLPAAVTSTAKIRVRSIDGLLTDVSDLSFAIVTDPPTPPPSTAAKIIINEILANEPSTDPAFEFIEVVNTGDAAVDMSNWTLSDQTLVRHTFAVDTILAPKAAIIVYGQWSAIPANMSNGVAASSGQLSLTNSGDTVALTDANGTKQDSVTYASALSSRDGVSMTRQIDGDGSASMVLHDTVSSTPSSPGARSDGLGF